uniref:Uncharacterized protein n=1 Tax=Anguilla anguilla TaxID=7936 RepID=A0A0E9S7U9_ANGAN
MLKIMNTIVGTRLPPSCPLVLKANSPVRCKYCESTSPQCSIMKGRSTGVHLTMPLIWKHIGFPSHYCSFSICH